MKITRNEIVGAWLWLRKRPTMSLYLFRKYHMLSCVPSLHHARKIANIVGDIDAAKARTCGRDDWRQYRSNVLAPANTFCPYSTKYNGVTALIAEIRRGEKFYAHRDHVRLHAPAAYRQFFKN